MRKFISLFITSMILKSVMWANPQNPTVVAGSASFDSSIDALLHVTAEDRSIISWDSFSIAANETTLITLPNATSTVLNRVITEEPSTLAGFLQSNGQVYLINQNGILVTNSGVINTAGFLASTLDVLDTDFLAGGDLLFAGTTEAGIVHQGSITAWNGDVVLLGFTVESDQVLAAPNGVVAVGAGETILLTPACSERISIQLSMSASGSGTGIRQSGKIAAIQAELKADGSLYALAIQSEGIVQATTTETVQGRIYLVAPEGNVIVTGLLEATGFEAQGGEIQVLGDAVTLTDRARINASGDAGGGTILIGGSFQGSDPSILNAQQTYVDASVNILSNATGNSGNGGQVVVWAEGVTFFYGNISAEASPFSGDGGSVEVSGLNFLDFQGNVSTNALNGITGTLLLDPTDITINSAGPTTAIFNVAPCGVDTYCGGSANTAAIKVSDLLTQLLLTNVIVNSSQGTGSGPSGGLITLANALTVPAGSFNLTFNARTGITLNASITNNSSSTIALNSGTGASGSMTLAAGINLANTSSGNLTLIAGSSTVDTGTITDTATTTYTNSGSGNMSFTATGTLAANSLNLSGSLSHTSTGTLQMTTLQGKLLLNSAFSLNVGAGAGPVTLSATGTSGLNAMVLDGSLVSAASSNFQILVPQGDLAFASTADLNFTGGSPVLIQLSGTGEMATLSGTINFAGTGGSLTVTTLGQISLSGVALTYASSGNCLFTSTTNNILFSGTNPLIFNSGAGNLILSAPEDSITLGATTALTFNAGAGSLSMTAGTMGLFNGSVTITGPIVFDSGVGQSITMTANGNLALGNLTYNSTGNCTLTTTNGNISTNLGTTLNWGPLAAAGNLIMNASQEIITNGSVVFSSITGTSPTALSMTGATNIVIGGTVNYSSPFNWVIVNTTSGQIATQAAITLNAGSGGLLATSTVGGGIIGISLVAPLINLGTSLCSFTTTASPTGIALSPTATLTFSAGAPLTFQSAGFVNFTDSIVCSGGAGPLQVLAVGTILMSGSLTYSDSMAALIQSSGANITTSGPLNISGTGGLTMSASSNLISGGVVTYTSTAPLDFVSTHGAISVTSPLNMNTSAPLSITTSPGGGDISILNLVTNSGTGTMTVNAALDLILGGDDILVDVQLGSAGGDLTLTAGRDVILQAFGDTLASTYCQIGYNTGTVNSNILFTSIGRNLILDGGPAPFCYAVIGHGSQLPGTTGGTRTGNITFGPIGGNASLLTYVTPPEYGVNSTSFVQIGHLRSLTGAVVNATGNIEMTQLAGTLTLQGANSLESYALIGHGGGSSPQADSFMGNVQVEAGGTISLIAGTATEAFVGIGHAAFLTASGTITLQADMIEALSESTIAVNANTGAEAFIGMYINASAASATGSITSITPMTLPTVTVQTGTGADLTVAAATPSNAFNGVLIGLLSYTGAVPFVAAGNVGGVIDITTGGDLILQAGNGGSSNDTFAYIMNGIGTPPAGDYAITMNVGAGIHLLAGNGDAGIISLNMGSVIATGLLEIQSSNAGQALISTVGNLTIDVGSVNMNATLGGQFSTIETLSGNLSMTSGLVDLYSNATISSGAVLTMTLSDDLLIEGGSSISSVAPYTIDVTGNVSLFSANNVIITGDSTGNLTVLDNIFILADATGSAQITASGVLNVASTVGSIYLIGFPGQSASINTSSSTLTVTAADVVSLLNGADITVNGGASDLSVTATAGSLFVSDGSQINNFGLGFLTLSGENIILRDQSNVTLVGSGLLTLNALSGDLTIGNGVRIQNSGTGGIESTVGGTLMVNGGFLGEAIVLAGVGGVSFTANQIVMNGFSSFNQAAITAQGGALTLSSTLSLSLDANALVLLSGGSGAFEVTAGTSLNVSETSILQNQGSGTTTVTAVGPIAILEGASLRGNTGDLLVQSMETIALIDGSFVSAQGNVSLLSSGNILFSSSYVQTMSNNLSLTASTGNLDFMNGSSAKISAGSGLLTVMAVAGSLNVTNGSSLQNNGTGNVVVTVGADGLMTAGNAGPSFISGKTNLTVGITGSLIMQAASNGSCYLSCTGTGAITAGSLTMTGFSSTFPAQIQDTTGMLTVEVGSSSLADFSQIVTTGGTSVLTVNATSGDLRIANNSFIQNAGTGAVSSMVNGTLYIEGGPFGAAKIQSGNGDVILSANRISMTGFSSPFNAVITGAKGNLVLTSTLSMNLNAHAQLTLTSPVGIGTLQLTVGEDFLAANDTLIQNYGAGMLIVNVMAGINLLGGAGNVILETSTGSIELVAMDALHLAADFGGFVSIVSSGNITVSTMADLLLVGSSGSVNTASIKTTSGTLSISANNVTLRDKASLTIIAGSGVLSIAAGGDLNVENGSSIAQSGTGLVNCTSPGNLLVRSGLSGSSYIANNGSMNLLFSNNINIEAANGFQSYISSKGPTLINALELNLIGVNTSAPATIKNAAGALTVDASSLNLLNFGQILLTGGAGTLTVDASAGDLRLTNGSLIAQQGTGAVSCVVNQTLFIEGGPLGLTSLTAVNNLGITAQEIFLAGFSSTNSAQISSSQGNLQVASSGMTTLNPFARISLAGGPLPFFLMVGSDLTVANGSTIQRGGTGAMAVTVTGAASLIGGAADSSITGNTGAMTFSVGGMLRLLSAIQGKAYVTSAGNTTISAGADIILLGALEAGLQAYMQTTAGTLSVTAQNNLKLYDLGAIAITGGAGTLTVAVTNGDFFLENGSYVQQNGTGALQATIMGNATVKSGWAGSSFLASNGPFTMSIGEDLAVEAAFSFSAYLAGKGSTSVTANRLVMDGFSTAYTANISNTTGNLTVTAGSLNLLNFSNIQLTAGTGAMQVNATTGNFRMTNGAFLQNQGSGAFNVSAEERLYLTGGSAGASSILGGSAGVTVTANSILMGGGTSGTMGVISSSLGTLTVNTAGMLNMTPFSKIQLTSGPNNVNVNVSGTLYKADNTSITTLGTGMVNITAGSTVICHP